MAHLPSALAITSSPMGTFCNTCPPLNYQHNLHLPCKSFLVKQQQHLLLQSRVPFLIPAIETFSSTSTFHQQTILTVCRSHGVGQEDKDTETNLDVSVFRFTLGIPGFDDSELPRILGFCFGALILLNHFLTVDTVSAAQLRSEVVGLFLALVSVNLPGIGKSLEGSEPVKAESLGSNYRQVFALANGLSEAQKEELAWASYTLLRNTSTVALAIWWEELLCARGYWDIPKGSEAYVLGWLQERLKKTPLLSAAKSFYLPSKADSQGWEFVPKGAVCLLTLPLGAVAASDTNGGVIVLLSNVPSGYSEKDRAWVAALAEKFSKITP